MKPEILKHFEARTMNARQALFSAINAPVFTAKRAEEILDGMNSAQGSDGHKTAVKMLGDAGSLALDTLYGTLDKNFWAVAHGTEKTVTGELLPSTPAGSGVMNNLVNLYDELALDMEWMPILIMGDLRSSIDGVINDYKSLIQWGTYGPNENIKVTPYLKKVFQFLERLRHGGGVGLDRWEQSITRGREMVPTMNNVFAGMRWKSLEYKAQFAYALIQAAIAAANSASQVTTFVTGDLPQTLNNAVFALKSRLKDTGRMISDAQPVHMYASSQFKGRIATAFAATGGLDGENETIQHNIVPHFTYNLAADLGISGSKAVLVYPGGKNVWGDFAGLEFGEESKLISNSLNLIGQENYNASLESLQFQIVNIA